MNAALDGLVGEVELGVSDFQSYCRIVDCRTLKEFDRDCIPGAVHLEVLTREDEAKVRVACRDSRQAGDALAEELANARVQAWLKTHASCKEKRVLIYGNTTSGGMRIQAVANAFRANGVGVDVLHGGWEDYARWVSTGLEQVKQTFRFNLVSGTASGQGLILDGIKRAGGQVLDMGALLSEAGSKARGPVSRGAAILTMLRSMDVTSPVWIEFLPSEGERSWLPREMVEIMAAPQMVCLVSAPPGERFKAMKTKYSNLINEPAALVETLISQAGMGSELIHWLQEVAASVSSDEILARVMSEFWDKNYSRAMSAMPLSMQQVSTLQIKSLCPQGVMAAAAALMSCENY